MTPVGVLFFPQRPVLRLDGRQYDSRLLEMVVRTGGSCKSYTIAAKLIESLLGLGISAKQLSLLTSGIGGELQEARDKRTETWTNRLLTDAKTVAEPPLQLACVQIDGGRMQTRKVGCGQGVTDPHWRETKNAGFHRMATETHSSDPCPELPACFSNRQNMRKLLSGLGEEESPDPPAALIPENKPDLSWRPKPLFRSCLSSLVNSETFGPMMAAEADRRGFFTAHRRAFLGDGLNYNWSIQESHFPTFEPILDFIHAIEHLHEVSQALEPDRDASWQQTVSWIEEVWCGNVEEVLGILQAKQLSIGTAPKECDDSDPRQVLESTIGYLKNNSHRMNYPEYRRQGLPITSCLIESQVKEMNHRVKGSEKFWNDGFEGEAILQVTAALLSDDDPLASHFGNRPGSPYDRNRPKSPTKKH